MAIGKRYPLLPVCGSGLPAPMVLGGPINGLWFHAYVGQVLVPALSSGDIVVAENLGGQQGAGVRKAIEAADTTLLYLPPSSADFNPIERTLKALLRKVAERSVNALRNRIGVLLKELSNAECANHFAVARDDPAGYEHLSEETALRALACAIATCRQQHALSPVTTQFAAWLSAS